MVIVPWWAPLSEQPAWAKAHPSVPVGKSNVERRQLIPALSADGAPVLVNAMQYTVLIRNLGTSGIQSYGPPYRFLTLFLVALVCWSSAGLALNVVLDLTIAPSEMDIFEVMFNR